MEERVVLSAATGGVEPSGEVPSIATNSIVFLESVGTNDSFVEGTSIFATAESMTPADLLRNDIHEFTPRKLSVGDFVSLTNVPNSGISVVYDGQFGVLGNGLIRGRAEYEFESHVPFSGVVSSGRAVDSEGLSKIYPIRIAEPDDPESEGGYISLPEVPESPFPDPQPPVSKSPSATSSAPIDEPGAMQDRLETRDASTDARGIAPSRGRALAIDVAISVDATYDDPAITGSSSDGARANGLLNAAEFDPSEITPVSSNDARPSGSDDLKTGRAAASSPLESAMDTRFTPPAHESAVRSPPANAGTAPPDSHLPTGDWSLALAHAILEEEAAGDPHSASPSHQHDATSPESAHDAAFAAWGDSVDGFERPSSLPLWLRNHAREPLVWALLVAASAGQVVYAPGPARRHQTEQLPPRRRR